MKAWLPKQLIQEVASEAAHLETYIEVNLVEELKHLQSIRTAAYQLHTDLKDLKSENQQLKKQVAD